MYDLVAVSAMAKTAVNLLQAVEAEVETLYREHSEADDMIRQMCHRRPVFGRTACFLRSYYVSFTKTPLFFRGDYIESRYDHCSGRPRSEKDDYERTEEGKAILHAEFQELVSKAQIADDPVNDELSRGFWVFIGPASRGMQPWLVFAGRCLLEAHRVLGPELHLRFEQLRSNAKLIRGNIQADLNIRQPFSYNRETLENDARHHRPVDLRRPAGDHAQPARGDEQALRAAQELPDLLRPPAALAAAGAARPRAVPLQRGAVRPVLGAPLQGAATGGASREPVGGHGRADRAPGRRRRRRRRTARGGYQKMLLLSYGYSPLSISTPKRRANMRVRLTRENARKVKELAPVSFVWRERFRSARIHSRADGVAKIVEHSTKNRRGVTKLLQKLLVALEAEDGGASVPAPGVASAVPQDPVGAARPVRPFPVEGPRGTRVVESIETEGPEHAYLSVGVFLLDIVFDNMAFRLDDHDPVTRAERKRATVAAVKCLLGRGAWGSYINELLGKGVLGEICWGCAEQVAVDDNK
ncbi:hypothetical protein DL769_006329 [Monosporascus sp. CRB-8-3]|nr:hypothetical protein DL769_006329 [Monosporascus sp. CRB-8-3]